MTTENTATVTPDDLDLGIEGVDLGAVDTTEAAEDTDFPTLTASPFHYEPDAATGKSKKVYDVVYGFELARHAEVRQGRGFRKNEKVFSFRARCLQTVPDTDFRPTIFDEFGRFPTTEEVKARILADTEIPASEKESKLRSALAGLRFEKARMVSLAKAVAPMTLNDLKTRGQGVLVGVAIDRREQKNGSFKNVPLKYFLATAINADAQGTEPTEVDVAGLDGVGEDDIPF